MGGSQEGFAPYLLGDKGCSLLPWIMTPHKEGQQQSVLELLYNRKHKQGQLVVENAFSILKQSFREFLYKTNIGVNLVPNVFTC
jgi:hypothetical protein